MNTELELQHIKHELEKIRDHLYEDRLEIALYKLGYMCCYINNLIENELHKQDEYEEEDG